MVEGISESCDAVRRETGTLSPDARNHVLACESCAEWLAAQSAPVEEKQVDRARAFAEQAATLPVATPGARRAPHIAVVCALWLIVALALPLSLSGPALRTHVAAPSMLGPRSDEIDQAVGEWTKMGAMSDFDAVLGQSLLGLANGNPTTVAHPYIPPSATVDRALEHLMRSSRHSQLVWLGITDSRYGGFEVQRKLIEHLLTATKGQHDIERLQVLHTASGKIGLSSTQRSATCVEGLDLIRDLERTPGTEAALARLWAPTTNPFCARPACWILYRQRSGPEQVARVAYARLSHAHAAGGWREVLEVAANARWRRPTAVLLANLLAMAALALLALVLLWVAWRAWRTRGAIRAALVQASARDRLNARRLLGALVAGSIFVPVWIGGLLWWPITDAWKLDPWDIVHHLAGLPQLAAQPRANAELALCVLAAIGLCVALETLHAWLLDRAAPDRAPSGTATALLVPLTLALFAVPRDTRADAWLLPMFATALVLAARFIAPMLAPRDRLTGARVLVATLALMIGAALAAVRPNEWAAARPLPFWIEAYWLFGLAMPMACGYVRAHLTPGGVRATRWMAGCAVVGAPGAVVVVVGCLGLEGAGAEMRHFVVMPLVGLCGAVAYWAHAVGVRIASPLAGAVE